MLKLKRWLKDFWTYEAEETFFWWLAFVIIFGFAVGASPAIALLWWLL